MRKDYSKKSPLVLRIENLGFSFEIYTFDGCAGTLAEKVNESSPGVIYRAEISSIEQGKPLWSGDIRMGENSKNFELLVIADAELDSDLNWSALPKILSVFDGGYRALEKKETERLLSDLIDFHERVNCKVHFQEFATNHYFSVRFTEQDNLKALTEILVQIKHFPMGLELSLTRIYVLEIELFEISYFMISTLEAQEDDLLIFRLTNHFYEHSKREGRRIQISDLNVWIEEGKVLEVSDFGIRIETSHDVETGSEVALSIGGKKIGFHCIFSANGLVGLKLIDHSPLARAAWQTFLLQFQYPELVTRNPSLHETTWKLFGEAGYFNLPNGVGELVQGNKKAVLNEWGRVDQAGPDQGTCVLAKTNESHIGTIGVTRINQGIWLSQALATSKDPNHINHTRSLYAWRSRVIIQQQDGLWNLAFFSAKKVFLDRFFRKFLLLLAEDETQFVSWEEKNHYYILPKKITKYQECTEESDVEFNSRLFKEFSKLDQAAVSVATFGKSHALISPAHLSLAQMAISLWSKKFDPQSTNAFSNLALENGHTFASLFLDEQINPSNVENETFKIVGGQPFVVWMCARVLIPKFLANSLRAFEIMHSKYGSQEVA